MFRTNHILQTFNYTSPISTGPLPVFKPFMPNTNGTNTDVEFTQMFHNPGNQRPRNTIETDLYAVTGIFTETDPGFCTKPDGIQEYRTLLKNLESFKSQANNKAKVTTNNVLINKIVHDFHYLVQFVGQHSQLLLVKYSAALEANEFAKALILLNHIYSRGATGSYKLPLIFECSRSFLVADLNIDTIRNCPIEGSRPALCDLINVLQNSTAKLNVCEFDNTIFKFPIANLFNTNYGMNEMPTILLPSCLIDTNLLLTTTYYTDSILADCLLSLGASQTTVDLIKELLISTNPRAVIIGKVCLVASTYENMFKYAQANNSRITGFAKGYLVERLYRAVVGIKGDGSGDNNTWIKLIGKIYFGSLSLDSSDFC